MVVVVVVVFLGNRSRLCQKERGNARFERLLEREKEKGKESEREKGDDREKRLKSRAR